MIWSMHPEDLTNIKREAEYKRLICHSHQIVCIIHKDVSMQCVIKAAKREEKTRASRLQCGTVPFQRVPSQKSRGDPSRTPPSSHLVLIGSSIIEILGIVLRSDLPMNFIEQENQLRILLLVDKTLISWCEGFVSH